MKSQTMTKDIKAAREWAENKIQSEHLHLKESTPSFESYHQDNIAHLRTLTECARRVEKIVHNDMNTRKNVNKGQSDE